MKIMNKKTKAVLKTFFKAFSFLSSLILLILLIAFIDTIFPEPYGVIIGVTVIVTAVSGVIAFVEHY